MLASFITLTLFSGIQLACSRPDTRDRRETGISLSLYTDQRCSTLSASSPNVTLGLNVCAVTTGMESFLMSPTPCISGDVAAWVFTDVACGTPASDSYRGANGNNNCYATYEGAMAAVMLTCDADPDETEPSQPTSTTTIVVGPVANEPTSTTGGLTATAALPSTSSSATSNGGTQDTSTPKTGWNSLNLGPRIGIILALSFVGLMLIGCLFRGKKASETQQVHHVERNVAWVPVLV